MNENNTDVVQLFVILATSIFGPTVATVIGPYLLIIFAAITGATWSLGRRDSSGKVSAFFYFLRIVFTAVLLTVLIAQMVASYLPQPQEKSLIAPVALIIGIIGDDWLKLFSWLLVVSKKFADKLINKKLGE